jgi:alpha-ketoglutarate-dependent taurine dioxygenase
VGLSEVGVTRSAAAAPDRGLPLVVRPAVGDADLAAWVRRDRDAVRESLLKHGAILFRGFETESVAAFGEFASSVCTQLFAEYGDLPRDSGAQQKVYTSTPYPADRMILYHNESSHMHQWPQKIMFHCVTAARSGGETPIADCREVYRRLAPGVRRRFEEKGLLYVRNFKQRLDVRWQDFFRAEDPAVVERYCREAGEEFEWVGGAGLRTHPLTGERVFFNQMLAHHPSCLEPGERASLLELFGEDGLPRDVRYGDGTPIEDSAVAEVKRVYDEAAIALPWEEGDIMLLDNMLAVHARNPFVGPRKIVVAMGEMVSLSDCGAWRAAGAAAAAAA